MNKKGLLISIEGIDGCGKSTLAKNLLTDLKNENLNVVLTFEPGQTVIGSKIKKILYEEKTKGMSNNTEYLLFAANRAQHFHEVVIPALNNGKIVISDRMNHASLAYQGYGADVDIEMIKTIDSWAMNNIKQDLIIYIRLDKKEAYERILKRKEKPTPFEAEKAEYWLKVIEGYETIFKKMPNVLILDGNLTPIQLVEKAKIEIFKLL